MQSEQLRNLRIVNLMYSILWFYLDAVSGKGEVYCLEYTCGSSEIIRPKCKYLVMYHKLLESISFSSFYCG